MTSAADHIQVSTPLPWFNQQEKMLLCLLAFVGLLTSAATILLERAVAWDIFGQTLLINAGALIFGAYIRANRGMARMGLAMIGLAFYMSFGAFMLILANSFFPTINPIIDDQLVKIDAVMGYHWAGFVNGLAEYPTFGKSLMYVYGSSLIQLAVLFAVLSWSYRPRQIYQLVATGSVSLLMAITIWVFFPSFGPSAHQTIAPEVSNSIGLFTDNAYGADLLDRAQNGLSIIAPTTVKATIAFPSFHIVMACMTVWFARGLFFFWPAVVLNTLMIPATLAHGGHHLIDLIGGVIVFVVALKLTAAVFRKVAE